MQELKRIRNERGWSQRRLAKEAGVDQVTVNHIETGKRSPNVETLEKLARALDIDLADFFPKAQAPLPLDWDVDPARGIQSDGLYKVDQPDKVFRLGELICKAGEAEYEEKIKAGDTGWIERLTQTLSVYADLSRNVDVTQLRDPESALARIRYMKAMHDKFDAALDQFVDPDYRHRFAKILEASGEQMREMVASG